MDSWPPHGIHMPGRGYWKGSRKGLEWRKCPCSSTWVMPKGFHKFCKASQLVPLIHEFVVNMMHWEAMSTNQIVYTHLPCSGTISSSPSQSTQRAAKNPPPGFAGKGWEHKTATRHLQDLEYFVFSTSTCTSWASLLLPPIMAKRTESSLTAQCPEICILQKLHLFLSIRNKPLKPELIHEHFFSRNSSQGIL